MGGYGGGRHGSPDTKDSIDNYRAIDVRRWQRDGLLAPDQSFRWDWTFNRKTIASIRVHTKPGQVILNYCHRSGGKAWEDESYPVRLDWTACNFGGERPWLLCPALGCGRRVAVLYGGKIFACRHCHQLAYPSQRETYDDRAARRANKIRDKLGWELGILNGNLWKPKGMHWNTFNRLMAQHDAFVAVSLAGITARLTLLGESLDDWI